VEMKKAVGGNTVHHLTKNKCFSVYSGMLKNFKGHEKIMRGVKLSKNIQCCLSLHITIPLLNKSNLVGWSL
jgi:hypothetical protein